MDDLKNLNNDNPNEIKFDVLKIDSSIKKDSSYKEGENLFQFCPEYINNNQDEHDLKIDIPKYIARIKSPSFEYLGILSKNLKKENYGYNHFDNGDEYFGQWNKDKKEGYGIYFFNEDNSTIIKQIYIGEFKNNIKTGEGIYFKVTKFDEENKENNFLPPLDFTLVIGNFLEDNFIKGIIYSIDGGKRKIYKGKMNKEGKKSDDNAEIYEDDNKIFYGIVKENAMIEGRIIIMKDGEKENGYYFTRKGTNNLEGEIDFDYDKGEKGDDKYIRKLNELNNIFEYEKLQHLFINVMKIREKVSGKDNFEYMKTLNYDVDVKLELKDQYGKYLYC